MKRLLLLSTSAIHGSGYMEYCADDVTGHLGDVRRVLFVPYALQDRDAYAAKVRARFTELGYELDSIHQSQARGGPRAAVRSAEAIFIGGGNTFRLLSELYAHDVLDAIRERVDSGVPYMGSSAGSNVACITIKTTNDMPIVYPPSFDALALVPFNINPHYLDPDPASTHMGETRETRLREFHEMNDPPVVGLREGAILRIEGPAVTLIGRTGARLFRKGAAPVEHVPGDRLDFLLR
jgi:dipeptidase E